MSLGTVIANHRKKQNITQESLAQQLGVTNQAVSKWESEQCCPDVILLPRLADLFQISMDELFERVPTVPVQGPGLPWPEDDTLHAVLYRGHTLLTRESPARHLTFVLKGDALNVESAFSVTCGDVHGNIDAGTSVSCGNVEGSIDAGTHVSCGNVVGDIDAGTDVNCGNVEGDIDAGANVSCGNVAGDVEAGANIQCSIVEGDASAGCMIDFGK